MSLSFQQMNLPQPILASLGRMKFSTPTEIQAAAIPLILSGKDIIGCAQTGTGKTAAFCIPIVAKLLEQPQSAALILAPTRELAQQIAEVARQLTQSGQIKLALLIGGTDMQKQIRDLKGNPRLVIGTPGRVTDHLKRKTLNLERVATLVLDEGDRMLDMGFEPQINQILKFASQDRQTLLFSATMPERIRKLADRYQKSPEFVRVGELAKPVRQIRHSVVQTTAVDKKRILLDQLNTRAGSVVIFVNTQHGTSHLTSFLEEYGYPVTQIHGGRSQGQRKRSMDGFRRGQYRILVATDVAARGIDVPHIAHVINYELPQDHDDYVHRIGRTARAGAEGQALCLLTVNEYSQWNRIARINNLGPILKHTGHTDSGSGGHKRSKRSGTAFGGRRRQQSGGPRPRR